MNLRTLLPSLTSIGLLAVAALLAVPLRADENGTIGTDVVTEFTPLGRKLPIPTAAHPTYYLPLPYGYDERGEILNHFQRAKPDPQEVEKLIVRMLAEQHYLLVPKTIRPDIVLTMKWGYRALNKKSLVALIDMNELVGGTMVNLLDPRQTGPGSSLVRREAFTDLLKHPRWYIELTAMNFDDWRAHKVTLLWRESTSADLWGHYLDEVLPTMILASAPYVGRPMDLPALASVPLTPPPAGWVTVGQPVEILPNKPSGFDGLK